MMINTSYTLDKLGTAIYCGVIDFTSPHSSAAILPLWVCCHFLCYHENMASVNSKYVKTLTFTDMQMIKNLKIAEGEEIKIKVASLAKGKSLYQLSTPE